MAHLEYLISHGRAGSFGRFRSPVPMNLGRGTAVVVRGERGLELGEVLRPATPRHAAQLPASGELVRSASEDDLAAARTVAVRAGELLVRAGELIAELHLPLAVLDAEVLLDGSRGTLFLVRRGSCDVRELVRPLSREFELILAAEDLTAETADGGCGSCGTGGGCGSGDCGSGSCGTGGCGSGSCASASPEEIRAYFLGLREKMEVGRVPLL